MEEALQLQAEEVELEQHRCDLDSLSSVGAQCQSVFC